MLDITGLTVIVGCTTVKVYAINRNISNKKAYLFSFIIINKLQTSII